MLDSGFLAVTGGTVDLARGTAHMLLITRLGRCDSPTAAYAIPQLRRAHMESHDLRDGIVTKQISFAHFRPHAFKVRHRRLYSSGLACTAWAFHALCDHASSTVCRANSSFANFAKVLRSCEKSDLNSHDSNGSTRKCTTHTHARAHTHTRARARTLDAST